MNRYVFSFALWAVIWALFSLSDVPGSLACWFAKTVAGLMAIGVSLSWSDEAPIRAPDTSQLTNQIAIALAVATVLKQRIEPTAPTSSKMAGH